VTDEVERNAIAAWLDAHGACGDGAVWARTRTDFRQLWYECPHIEWLLWGVAQTGYRRNEPLRRFAVACASRRKSGWGDDIFAYVVGVATAHADGHVGTIELLQARRAGVTAAERLASAEHWTQSSAAARAAAIACTRVDPILAARGAALEALRALEWAPDSSSVLAREQQWQVDELRGCLHDDVAPGLWSVRQTAQNDLRSSKRSEPSS
jgi:hypothetical protein